MDLLISGTHQACQNHFTTLQTAGMVDNSKIGRKFSPYVASLPSISQIPQNTEAQHAILLDQ